MSREIDHREIDTTRYGSALFIGLIANPRKSFRPQGAGTPGKVFALRKNEDFHKNMY